MEACETRRLLLQAALHNTNTSSKNYKYQGVQPIRTNVASRTGGKSAIGRGRDTAVVAVM